MSKGLVKILKFRFEDLLRPTIKRTIARLMNCMHDIPNVESITMFVSDFAPLCSEAN